MEAVQVFEGDGVEPPVHHWSFQWLTSDGVDLGGGHFTFTSGLLVTCLTTSGHSWELPFSLRSVSKDAEDYPGGPIKFFHQRAMNEMMTAGHQRSPTVPWWQLDQRARETFSDALMAFLRTCHAD